MKKVAKPSDFGLQYIEETLVTKDKVKLKSYIIIQRDENMARKSPTILYFHVSLSPILSFCYAILIKYSTL
jgi:hypothetical protein